MAWCWSSRGRFKNAYELLNLRALKFSPVPGEFLTQRPVTRSFDVFFDLRLNKRLSKQSWGWWFETLSRPLWRQCNVCIALKRYVGYIFTSRASDILHSFTHNHRLKCLYIYITDFVKCLVVMLWRAHIIICFNHTRSHIVNNKALYFAIAAMVW